MSSVPTSYARQKAIDRLITALQAEYGTELAAAKALYEQTPGQLDDLTVETPETDAYYCTPESPDDENSEAFAHAVAVFFMPDGPRELAETAGSYGPQYGTEKREFQMSIIVMVRHEIGEPITRNSKELSSREMLELRTKIYTGALVECLEKYACDHGESIHDIEFVSDDAVLEFVDDSLVGVGGATFRITQKTRTPRPRALP